MIASPSDIGDARDAVEAAIHGWNGANARTKEVILQPWRWETAAVPTLGSHPQSLINAQGVDESDIVFALFGSRLGAPTPDAVSGTVEEIERAIEQGKPVHLYFSSSPLPNDVDIEQLEGLRAFKSQIRERGLFGEFANSSQLEHEVWKAVEFDISQMALDAPIQRRRDGGVHFNVQPKQEREIRDYDSKGRPRYRTRHWVEVTNVGDRDAEGVIFEPAREDAGMFLSRGDLPTIVHKGQTRRFDVEYAMDGDGEDVLLIRWSEDGEEKQQEFHIG
ncbi:DUF4062 domain-containing protein [Brachybacterium sp. UNK5269]|uniref:DUF4062 domain-containing protein n=1 Tax=Brachybacterium sp. UNK5269 TaxID=3408576 RepID=UPI003BAEFEF8